MDKHIVSRETAQLYPNANYIKGYFYWTIDSAARKIVHHTNYDTPTEALEVALVKALEMMPGGSSGVD